MGERKLYLDSRQKIGKKVSRRYLKKTMSWSLQRDDNEMKYSQRDMRWERVWIERNESKFGQKALLTVLDGI